MKKLLVSLIITTGIVTSIGGVSIFAAGDTTSTVKQSISSIEAKIEKSDPLYLSLKEKQTTLQNLNKSEAAVLASIKAQAKTNKDLKAQLIKGRKSATKENFEGIRTQVASIEDSLLPLRQQKIDLYKKLADAIRSKDKETTKALNDQLKSVNQQMTTLEKQIKDLRTSVRDTSGDVKASKLEAKEVSEQVKALNAQMEALHADVLTLKSSKAAEWINFNTSIKSLDLAAANTSLDKIIGFKQQMIEKANQVLTLQKQITTLLNTLS